MWIMFWFDKKCLHLELVKPIQDADTFLNRLSVKEIVGMSGYLYKISFGSPIMPDETGLILSMSCAWKRSP